ncbi:MAG: hypothetical protein LH478_02160 [Chitinophagaceae bacterium]|nr:hypothetical protein [Chitinophagaceae bacterium]
MLANEEILLELSKISPALTTISRNHVYSVPLNYFDGLAGNILNHIKDDIAGHAFGPASNPYALPANYFASLPEAILGKIKKQDVVSSEQDELNEIAPLLSTISRQMPYKVADGYFETFNVNTISDTKAEGKTAKIIKTGWFNRSYKYAAAAVTAGIVIVSTVLFAPKTGRENTSESYITSINIPAAVNKISEDEINEFLDNNAVIPEASASNNTTPNDVDILQVIKNTSEQDIKDYLKQYEGTDLLKGKDS